MKEINEMNMIELFEYVLENSEYIHDPYYHTVRDEILIRFDVLKIQ